MNRPRTEPIRATPRGLVLVVPTAGTSAGLLVRKLGIGTTAREPGSG
jgi:hypothetical protein